MAKKRKQAAESHEESASKEKNECVTEMLEENHFFPLESEFLDEDEDEKGPQQRVLQIDDDRRADTPALDFLMECLRQAFDALDILGESNRQVIDYLYGITDHHPHSYEEVERKFSITREKIFMIEVPLLLILPDLLCMSSFKKRTAKDGEKSS